MEEAMTNNGPTRNMKQNVGEQLRKSRERLDELRAETQAKARRAVRVTNNYAHDHPWRIASTSIALGFIAGFLMNTKRPKRIVVKQPKPVIKLKTVAPKAKKKRSSFGAFQTLMPLALMGLKMYAASRPKNKIVPHPAENASAMGTAPVP
jgi:ElaB/YqjD/DUF883 family membrane-anchored ribosome-binding protein